MSVLVLNALSECSDEVLKLQNMPILKNGWRERH